MEKTLVGTVAFVADAVSHNTVFSQKFTAFGS